MDNQDGRSRPDCDLVALKPQANTLRLATILRRSNLYYVHTGIAAGVHHCCAWLITINRICERIGPGGGTT